MALLFNKPDVSTECCPMPQCRSIGTLLEQGGGKTWSVRTLIRNGCYVSSDEGVAANAMSGLIYRQKSVNHSVMLLVLSVTLNISGLLMMLLRGHSPT
jgi:hypothetical protein